MGRYLSGSVVQKTRNFLSVALQFGCLACEMLSGFNLLPVIVVSSYFQSLRICSPTKNFCAAWHNVYSSVCLINLKLVLYLQHIDFGNLVTVF